MHILSHFNVQQDAGRHDNLANYNGWRDFLVTKWLTTMRSKFVRIFRGSCHFDRVIALTTSFLVLLFSGNKSQNTRNCVHHFFCLTFAHVFGLWTPNKCTYSSQYSQFCVVKRKFCAPHIECCVLVYTNDRWIKSFSLRLVGTEMQSKLGNNKQRPKNYSQSHMILWERHGEGVIICYFILLY